MKNLKNNHICAILSMVFLTACSADRMESFLRPLVKAPGSSIERNVKGHDQIYTVQAILRLAQKRSDGRSYAAYGISSIKEPPVPIYQEIDISKDDDGQITITSTRKCFDVVKSNRFYYTLELKYYDLNGKLINHQFSHYDANDLESSTLQHHQHFFTLENHSLTGQQLVYPMTLDSTYYDNFTFQRNADGSLQAATEVSPNNVYVDVTHQGTQGIRYHSFLAQRAVEKATTKEATATFTYKDGKQYRLFKTLSSSMLDEQADQIFTYQYRDTDPVEHYLYTKVKGVDDLGRIRAGKPTILLQKKRDLTTQTNRDYLGFKGVLQFKKSNIAFQMRICISHMLTSTEKYVGVNNTLGVLHEFNQISPSWNTFDIDYPLPFRVIADLDGDKQQFVTDIKKYYPQADPTTLLKMFGDDPDWFNHIPTVTI